MLCKGQSVDAVEGFAGYVLLIMLLHARRRFIATAGGGIVAVLLPPSVRGQPAVRRIALLTGFGRADADDFVKAGARRL